MINATVTFYLMSFHKPEGNFAESTACLFPTQCHRNVASHLLINLLTSSPKHASMSSQETASLLLQQYFLGDSDDFKNQCVYIFYYILKISGLFNELINMHKMFFFVFLTVALVYKLQGKIPWQKINLNFYEK